MKYRLLYGLLRMLTWQPLRLLYIYSDIAAFILYRVVGYRVGVVRKNLALSFPEKSEKERRGIEKAFYRHLCDVFIEAAKLANVSDKEIQKRVKINGIETVNASLESGKSVVLLLGHYGNWEWITSAALKLHPGAVMCEIYRPLRDKVMDKLMLKLRSRFGTENIPMNSSVRQLLGYHREGRNFVCGFISDQRPFTPELKHWTDFLGVDTAYVNGGEVIGTKLGADFYYVEMMPERRGHYQLSFRPLEPLKDGEENPYTRSYLKELEKSIRKKPSYWLWSHNRWKRTRQVSNA